MISFVQKSYGARNLAKPLIIWVLGPLIGFISILSHYCLYRSGGCLQKCVCEIPFNTYVQNAKLTMVLYDVQYECDKFLCKSQPDNWGGFRRNNLCIQLLRLLCHYFKEKWYFCKDCSNFNRLDLLKCKLLSIKNLTLIECCLVGEI